MPNSGITKWDTKPLRLLCDVHVNMIISGFLLFTLTLQIFQRLNRAPFDIEEIIDQEYNPFRQFFVMVSHTYNISHFSSVELIRIYCAFDILCP